MRNKGDWGVDVDIRLLLVSGHFVSIICSGIILCTIRNVVYNRQCLFRSLAIEIMQ